MKLSAADVRSILIQRTGFTYEEEAREKHFKYLVTHFDKLFRKQEIVTLFSREWHFGTILYERMDHEKADSGGRGWAHTKWRNMGLIGEFMGCRIIESSRGQSWGMGGGATWRLTEICGAWGKCPRLGFGGTHDNWSKLEYSQGLEIAVWVYYPQGGCPPPPPAPNDFLVIHFNSAKSRHSVDTTKNVSASQFPSSPQLQLDHLSRAPQPNIKQYSYWKSMHIEREK